MLAQTASHKQGKTAAHALAQAAGPSPSVSGDPDCYCRAQGQKFALGAQLCLQTPGDALLARCVMSQNVTSWEPLSEPCPQS